MISSGIILICLGYILGIVLAAITKTAWIGLGLIILGLIVSIYIFKWQKQAFKDSQLQHYQLMSQFEKKGQKKPKKKSQKSETKSPDVTPAPLTPLICLLPSAKGWWVGAGLVGCLAGFYFQSQIPAPAPNDISEILSQNPLVTEQMFMVRGKVLSVPRMTRSQRAQFWLEAQGASEIVGQDGVAHVNQNVQGKVYVTAPILQATGLHPGQGVEVTGTLYEPKTASTPGGFDFQKYLAKQGAFVGLAAKQLTFNSSNSNTLWNFWQWRDRILRAQVERLGVPEGSVLSAIVMGRQAVEIPHRIRDQFIQVGLAHVIAASGFHVSLLLGLILLITRRFSASTQFVTGISILFLYVCLTGFSASVLRAFLMGGAALVGLVWQRQVKPMSALIIAAAALLIMNPLWVEDLGFQMSFLATWGLLVTVTPMQRRLDWLPPVISTLIAVPIAASIWVLPLQLYVFGVISPYSVVVNLVTSPLIWLISLGGMMSAGVALILPVAGSYLAWLLYFPLHGFLWLTEWFSQLPGNQVAVGTLSRFQVIALYLILAFICVWGVSVRRKMDHFAAFPELIPRGKNGRLILPKIPLFARWWCAGLVAFALVVVPGFYIKMSRLQITVLDTGWEPILIVQNQGSVMVVNSGNENTVRFTVLPFLQKQGINQIDGFIALNNKFSVREGWQYLMSRLPIKLFYENRHGLELQNVGVQSGESQNQLLPVDQIVSWGSVEAKLINAEIPILQLRIQDQTWLFLGNIADQISALISLNLPDIDVLWWSGQGLSSDVLKMLKPEVAIASANEIDPSTVTLLKELNTELFWTGRDGTVQWTPMAGFNAALRLGEIE